MKIVWKFYLIINNPCEKCGSPMNENQLGVCFVCKKTNFNFVQAKSVFEYTDKPLVVIHNLKYNGKKYFVDYMVKYMLDIFQLGKFFPTLSLTFQCLS